MTPYTKNGFSGLFVRSTTVNSLSAASPMFGHPCGSINRTLRLVAGAGTMLDAAWHDKQLALPQLHRAVAEFDLELAL